MKNPTKLLLLVTVVLFGVAIGQNISSRNNDNVLGQASNYVAFENLSPEEMHETIVAERDLAIQKAKEAGDYKCCIHPPCTMCYMEANQWNNHAAGTCACDNLIAQGKEPCPQCKRGLCESEQETVCLL